MSAVEIQRDENLKEFVRRAEDTYVGMCYENFWTWEDYVKDEIRCRNSEMKVVDVLPIYVFGDEKQIEAALATMPFVSDEKVDHHYEPGDRFCDTSSKKSQFWNPHVKDHIYIP